MSDKNKLNDDKLTMLLKESLPYEKSEMPAVSEELMEKTLCYIREKAGEEENSLKAVSGKNRRNAAVYWISGAAACFALLAGAVVLSHTRLVKPDNSENKMEVVMDDQDEAAKAEDSWDAGGYESDGTCEVSPAEAGESSGTAGAEACEEDAFDDFSGTDDAAEEASDKKDISSSETDMAQGLPEYSGDKEEGNAEENSVSGTEGSLSGKNDKTESMKDKMQILSQGNIDSNEIIFPENILGCGKDNINSVVIETSNGGNELLTREDIDDFCVKMEGWILGKSDKYKISSKPYHKLSNSWTKKIIVQLKETDSISKTGFYTLLVYKDGFAVCPFPPSKSNPDLICRLYE